MTKDTPLQPDDIVGFRQWVYRFFDRYGRDFPWRENRHPYRILVSEVMLQQTQADRVVPKFIDFMEQFPTIGVLAAAPLRQVLTAWQGLGYNRRGQYLHQTAQHITHQHNGTIPQTLDELQQLPGIGPYTANAILTFAFNQPRIVIETNIRTVFIHHFFPHQTTVSDDHLQPLIEQTLNREQPYRWYSALMDYGTQLKKDLPNPTRRSTSYTKQSKFEGSRRQLRGQVVRLLTQHPQLSVQTLQTKIEDRDQSEIKSVINDLANEKIIISQNGMLALP